MTSVRPPSLVGKRCSGPISWPQAIIFHIPALCLVYYNMLCQCCMASGAGWLCCLFYIIFLKRKMSSPLEFFLLQSHFFSVALGVLSSFQTHKTLAVRSGTIVVAITSNFTSYRLLPTWTHILLLSPASSPAPFYYHFQFHPCWINWCSQNREAYFPSVLVKKKKSVINDAVSIQTGSSTPWNLFAPETSNPGIDQALLY